MFLLKTFKSQSLGVLMADADVLSAMGEHRISSVSLLGTLEDRVASVLGM